MVLAGDGTVGTTGDIIIGDITDLFGALLFMVDTIIAGLTTIHTDMDMGIIGIMVIMDCLTDIMAIEGITTTEVLPIAQAEEEVAIREEL